ncbi:MAG: OmpH family outer membrane protein [Bacteroidales bacterium]|jgi:outer membrane protein|nr:OmpH family outer membrane protein [Bacteroidales bacterium]
MKKVTKILALVMVLFATQSFAQTKLGHINMQELINLMPERDSAVVKLENYAKELDETMQGMQQEFNTKYQTYQQKSSTWTAAILEAKTKELQEMQERLQMFQQNAQQEMGQLQQQLYAPVFEKANKAIEKIGTEGGFTYVIDLSAGALIYKGANSIDLLPMAKKELGIPAEKVAPTQLAPQQPAE